MSNFKSGDIVERVAGRWDGMKTGDRATITSTLGRDWLELDGFPGNPHSADMFKLHLAAEDKVKAPTAEDAVNHPSHYTSDPSGVECITITRHRNFNIGNAFKYLWRNGLKDDAALSARQKQIQDLRKSVYYIEDEIERLESL